MKDRRERKSIFKRGKGRAFLRFLVGEMVLVVLVSVVYLFVLQGDIPIPANKPAATTQVTLPPEGNGETPEPSDEIVLAQTHDASAQITGVPEATPDASEAVNETPEVTTEPTSQATPAVSDVPVVTETPVPTVAPTEAVKAGPTSTPLPLSSFALPVNPEEGVQLPNELSDQLKLGLQSFRVFSDAEQCAVMVGGYGYIEGLDAASTTIYLVISEASEGKTIGMYKAISAPETANLSFEESSGSNLDQAFFTANLDVSQYEDGAYMLTVVAVNGDKVLMNYFDDAPYHFSLTDGVLASVE